MIKYLTQKDLDTIVIYILKCAPSEEKTNADIREACRAFIFELASEELKNTEILEKGNKYFQTSVTATLGVFTRVGFIENQERFRLPKKIVYKITDLGLHYFDTNWNAFIDKNDLSMTKIGKGRVE